MVWCIIVLSMDEEKENKALPASVLLVEDAKNWLQINTLFFESLGVTVTGVTNPHDAIEALKKGGFTHLICDGLKGGWKPIAQAAKETGVQKIVVLSGTETLREEVETGGFTFVHKQDVTLGKISHKDLLQLPIPPMTS